MIGPRAKDHVVYGAAEMRELLIISGSTRAAMFNLYATQLDRDTLVETLDKHRQRGWTAVDFVKFLCRATHQKAPTTAAGYLEFMAYGSPMLRAAAFQVKDHMFQQKKASKVLFTEEVPLLAWYWDLFFNMLLVPSTVFHAGLSSAERDTLQTRFNDAKDPLKLIHMQYKVGAFGMNMQQCCNDVIIMTPAENHGTEVQAMARPIRVSPGKPFRIILRC
jgi:hypothetical protein